MQRKCFQSFRPSVNRGEGGEGGGKLKNADNVMGSPINALKFFHTIHPLARWDRGGG